MLARMLESLGLFLGWRKQGDHEAKFFLELNDWLLAQCWAGWDNPTAIRHLLADRELRELAVGYLRLSIASPRAVAFLGLQRALGSLPLREPWGWKDPRTTFTLPLWLDIFPNARVIEVRRHGVDVAQSLRTRHQRIVAQRAKRAERLRTYFWLRGRQSRLTTSARCASPDEGLLLWSEYCAEAERQLAAHSGPKLSLRYEAFLADPREHLAKLAAFCGLDASPERVASAASGTLEGRAYAYLADPALRELAARHSALLARFGYSADGSSDG